MLLLSGMVGGKWGGEGGPGISEDLNTLFPSLKLGDFRSVGGEFDIGVLSTKIVPESLGRVGDPREAVDEFLLFFLPHFLPLLSEGLAKVDTGDALY